jgi:hypothetical protein
MNGSSDQQGSLPVTSMIAAMAGDSTDHAADRGTHFWLVRTLGGSGMRPPTSESYSVRASTKSTRATAAGAASTMHERLLVEADEAGIRALERALRESGGVQSVESEPAPDGDYLDEDHSAVVTLRHGEIVDD